MTPVLYLPTLNLPDFTSEKKLQTLPPVNELISEADELQKLQNKYDLINYEELTDQLKSQHKALSKRYPRRRDLEKRKMEMPLYRMNSSTVNAKFNF